MTMSRRLLALALALASCIEHTPEWYALTDEATARTTSESTSDHSSPTVTTATTSDGGGVDGSTNNTEASAGNTEASAGSDAGPGTNEGDTSETSAGLPIDPPPTVENLVCDPEKAEEIGPVSCTYLSVNATVAELLDDGQVVATGLAGDPLIFPVTSAPHNNPGSTITVRVRNEGGQTSETLIYQPSTVKDPGTEIWTSPEPNNGQLSMASAVALQGNYVVAAGVYWKNSKLVGTLRRYDLGGDWFGTADGWSVPHTEWTALPWLETAYLGPTGLAVDAEGNVILVGIAIDDDEPRSYVSRFHPDGTFHWEKPGLIGTEARGVGVQPDGTIYVAGARRTSVNPDRWDMEISVFGPDKTAYGPVPYSDPEDDDKERSERGRAVVVLKNGNVVVVGEREIWDPIDNDQITRGVALLFEGKGSFIGEWTSSGDVLKYDAILAAVATDEGFATCGYTHADPNEPGSKKQIVIRWHGEDLEEVNAARLEATTGAAVCNALGYNMDGATIVGAQVYKNGQNNDQWIFAVEDAASPRVDYRKYNGAGNGDDRILALDCEYKCAWAGAETVDGVIQWIAGLFRG